MNTSSVAYLCTQILNFILGSQMKRRWRFLMLLLLTSITSFLVTAYYLLNLQGGLVVFSKIDDMMIRRLLLIQNGQGPRSTFFALGRPSLDLEWNVTTIFGSGDFAIIGAFGKDSNGILQHLTDVLTNNSTVSVCHRQASQGLYENTCSHVENLTLVQNLLEEIGKKQMTHIFVDGAIEKTQKSISVLISQIFPISESINYLFCYGLPHDVITAPFHLNTNCPPCLCPSVFSSQTLLKKLAIFDSKLVYDDQLNNLANQLLKHSRFTPCLPMKNESDYHHEPSDVFLVGDSINLTASSAWAVRQLYERNGMQLSLEGGTLLGWYRNCSVVRDDVDIDFSLPKWSMNHDFYEKIAKLAHIYKRPMKECYIDETRKRSVNLKSTRIFGDLYYGIEVRFEVKTPGDPAVGVDVFILYLNESGVDYNYVQGFVTWERTVLHYALPKNLTLCSTIFLGDLYLVPCEPESYLASHYGNKWNVPNKRTDSLWQKQSNIIKRIKLKQHDWKTRKMFKSFEFSKI